MDSSNWIPDQGSEPTLDTIDWRTQLDPESRQRIVNKIMDTLKKHLPVSGTEGLHELRKIAQRFEDKIYAVATSKYDYLRKISIKMLTMETKSQSTIASNMTSNEGGPSNNPPDQGLVLQSQVLNPGQQHPNPRQQLLPQTSQNHVAPQPNLSSVTTLSQTPSQNISQNSNTQQPQNSATNSIGQNSNIQGMFPGSQRQMPGRQQVVPPQQQQQPQNQQILYQQQQQVMKHKLSQMQQQQQQQNLLQPNQLNTSQQSVMQTSSAMQPSTMQSSLSSSLPQNQQSNNVPQSTQSRLQQHSQIIRQQQQQNSISQQQQTPMTQQSILPAQQQQQFGGTQSNVTNGQHAQMLGQQNNVGDTLKSQRLHPQQNNLMNPQQRQQQQLINQQNNLANIHQQQSGNNVPGLQQQQFGTDSGNQGIQTSHHSAHMLQQPKVSMQQQLQQNASKSLASQSQQSQPQASQQQLMSQIHNQPAQMQQQMGLQQQPSSLQRDMQQKLQASGSLHQQQSALDQQKQLYQSQRTLPETPTTSVDSTIQTEQLSGGDWQEELYQKLQTMKENYLPDLNEIFQKIAMRFQQYDSTPQQPKSDQVEKLRQYRMMLERMITFLQIPKNIIIPSFKEKLGAYEKQIVHLISSFRPRKAISSLQPGQLPPTHMSSTPQSQSQVTSVQSHENQMISQMQPSNLQGSAATIQQNNAANLQHSSMSGLSTTQQNMLNTIQPSNSVDVGQGNSANSLQQAPLSSLQQNNGSTPQQTNINSLSSQGGVNVIQPNLNTHQSGSTMLQPQLKHQEHQMLQNQQYKQQYQQQGQLMQRQQLLPQRQQLHQPGKQQLSVQSQINQMNDINDMKMRQGIGVKPGVFQQHINSGQNSAYSHQQSKQGSPFQVASPQLFQAASPQIPQHSSPQVDQQTHQQSLAKVATPLQSSNSPFGLPTPSPPMAPSPMLVDSEKPIPGVSSSSAANVGQHTGGAAAPAQSLAIGTPGISASPLLAEFSGPDCAYFNTLAATSGKSTAEQPIDRLIRAVQSMSTETLTAAVNDISSVVSMSDRIAGSAPGNGSRAAVGEDLVSMTNCRLQARNFITQDGTNGIRKIKRYTSARPLNVKSSAVPVSKNDSITQLSASEASQQESTDTTDFKKPNAEAIHALLEEIQQINRRLIDTVVEISDRDVDPTAAAVAAAEGTEGTIVKCSFIPVALSPSLKSHYASLQYPIQPLRLLVPPNYPNSSPIFLDKFPVESCNGNEDLSEKAKSKFSMSLRNFSQPMSLKDIVKTWDVSARGVVSEYAQQFGGGTFSSKYGSWKDILTA
ncbi:mediator of RNA polymerase II transcription subunit 15a isoform X4 [Lathyrus oleraceus]|uniref:mediator of RNA polymerase II transcription subunit 15a isoform X4 n=1 Tax=Pisum sativum TaxID=3888 RepID=UPI0021D2762F|nr:mediator of RNA polymerase II transcription subunit 15a-like isoform X4 [Pisum sativum]